MKITFSSLFSNSIFFPHNFLTIISQKNEITSVCHNNENNISVEFIEISTYNMSYNEFRSLIMQSDSDQGRHAHGDVLDVQLIGRPVLLPKCSSQLCLGF